MLLLTGAIVISLAVVCAPWLAAAGRDADASDAERRKRIADMSEAERTRIERNLEVFQALLTEKQAALRELDGALAADARTGGTLNAVLANYAEWLKTLSPWQREELRQAATNDERLKLIADYKNREKQNSNAPPAMMAGGLSEKDPSRGGYFRSPPMPPDLPRGDLAAMMQSIEDDLKLRGKLPPLEVGAPDYRRYRLLLSTFLPSGQPDDETADRLIDLISSSEVREIADVIPGSEPRRRFVVAMLVKGTGRLWHEEYERRKPSRETLEAFVATLSAEEKQRIERSPDWEKSRRVVSLWMERNEPEFHREFMSSFARFFGGSHRFGDEERSDRPAFPLRTEGRPQPTPQPRPESGSPRGAGSFGGPRPETGPPGPGTGVPRPEKRPADPPKPGNAPASAPRSF